MAPDWRQICCKRGAGVSFFWAFMGFLAGFLLGRRFPRRAPALPAPASHEWAAFSQGAGPTEPDARLMQAPGRIYLHGPP